MGKNLKQAVKVAMALMIGLIVVLPFFWLILLSFKTDTAILNEPFSLPAGLELDNYRRALKVLNLPLLYKNTGILVIFTQILGLAVTFMSSYCLSRMVFKYEKVRNGFYVFFFFLLTIPSYLLLFPLYRVTIMFHLQNTYLSLILPLTATSVSFNTLIFVGFLRDFPGEIEEAAIIDGCGLANLCLRIVIPVIKPVFATLVVFNVIYVWNEYPLSVTLINDAAKMTVSLGASMFRSTYSMDYSGMVASAVLVIVPQLAFYILLQKYIIEGMTAGAVKG